MSVFAGTRAVTFDCWGTLIYESDFVRGRELRVAAVGELTGLGAEQAGELLQRAWQRHHDEWTSERQHGAEGIARDICAELGAGPEVETELVRKLEEASLQCEVAMVPGAAETLRTIKRAGLRTALICDTGFSPGRVVRELLGRHGLTDHLDHLVFSDEVGVPKPNHKMFAAALDAVGGGPAVHIGDLRRTDVAGARAAGLHSVRFRGIYDDLGEHPDADHVVDELSHLLQLLGLSS
ncbi:MAG TPA: HAD family hydrolase [Actinomycetota bacterium]|nr:HAD family hydrolase [Actinomycetota bacterium]